MLKTFCLHHADLASRKKDLKLRFDSLEMEVEWIESFHPKRDKLPRSNLTSGEVSLYLKHFLVLEEQLRLKEDFILVLEDDVELPDNFCAYVAACVEEFIHVNGDLLFIGECCGIQPANIKSDKLVYYDKTYTSRCTHGIIINLNCVDRLIRYRDDLDLPMDHKYNQMIKNENLRSCYAHPSIKQKSMGAGNMNLYESSLR